jgi:hypothetical protein
VRSGPNGGPNGGPKAASGRGNGTQVDVTTDKAEVAEWQTRRIQNPLFARTCRFKPDLRHQQRSRSTCDRTRDFSSSRIEAWRRSIEHRRLFLHQLGNLATVQRLVAFWPAPSSSGLERVHAAYRRADDGPGQERRMRPAGGVSSAIHPLPRPFVHAPLRPSALTPAARPLQSFGPQ